MIGAFAIITQGLITNLCDAFFMSWLLAVPSLSALAGSQSAKRAEGEKERERGGKKIERLVSDKFSHTHIHTSCSRARWVKAG